MDTITLNNGIYEGTEFCVITVGATPTKIDFVRQIDDLLISTVESDILVTWDLKEEESFDENKVMLLKTFDNLKEFGNLKSTHIVVRLKNIGDAPTKVYLCGQRN